MEYLSHGNQKFLGTVHSVGLATFLWAAFVCMRWILVIFSKTFGDLSQLSVSTNAFQVAWLRGFTAPGYFWYETLD
jgi:hypothetical protein